MGDASVISALVAAARKGDKQAFSNLVTMFLAAAVSTALSIVRRRDWAEDVTQIAFLRAWQNLGTLQANAAFSSWLMTIVRNCSRNWLRDHSFESRLKRESAAAEVAAPAATDAALPDAVWRLPEDQREVVILRFVNDLTYEEIAQALGQPLSMVRDRLYCARQALAGFLK
ncbi:MAG: sigma-70 family RNA polymerase sigma factor [Planctomycetes bacterium]|jgi:RNA polymerase sigma-70 factor (ECF subfamily)|nr:sigma-70 family RNA polymerase sigma factor [Planctomycetota bacterium]